MKRQYSWESGPSEGQVGTWELVGQKTLPGGYQDMEGRWGRQVAGACDWPVGFISLNSSLFPKPSASLPISTLLGSHKEFASTAEPMISV